MGMPPCRPAVDPSILIHRDPRAWEELLGRCVDLFIEKMRGVGVGDLRSLVDYSFEGHVAFPPPAGVRRGLRGGVEHVRAREVGAHGGADEVTPQDG